MSVDNESKIDNIFTKAVDSGVSELPVQHKKEKYKSRANRLADAIAQIEAAITEIESIKDELENWRDSMPENLQNSDKYSNLESAIDELDNVFQTLDNAVSDAGSIEIPVPFG